jgi:phosphatidylserine decarboxylase
MGVRTHDEIEARYQRSFGVRAGYLPKDRAVLDQWHAELASDLRSVTRQDLDSPAVRALKGLLVDDPIVRMYVSEMVEQVQDLPHQEMRRDTIKSVPELLAALNKIVTTAPTYGTKEKPGVHFPMSALFAYMMMTQAGEAVFRNEPFNTALRNILKEWYTFLNDEKSCSVLTDEPGNWLSSAAVEELRLDDFEIDKSKPFWGFTSWNDFFHRQIKP